MSTNIFRIFNPREPKQDPVEKRRAQLRKAQQSYRGRKDRYTRSLEAEIAAVRANESSLMQQNQGLRDTVQLLADLLSQNGISLPSNIQQDGGSGLQGALVGQGSLHTPSPPANQGGLLGSLDGMANDLSSWGSDQGHPSLPNELSVSSATNGSAGWYSSPEESATFQPTPVSLPPQTSLASVSPPAERQQRKPDVSKLPLTAHDDRTRVSELDSSIVGMEFVLTLERPCLHHVHGDPTRPFEPSGHALTATAQLQFALPPSSCPPPPLGSPPDAYQEHHAQYHTITPAYHDAPGDLLTRLLSLAPDVTSEGDVTPIQVWNYVKAQPGFQGLDIRGLLVLAERLRETVKCHGFGAVVKQINVEKHLYTAFAAVQAF